MIRIVLFVGVLIVTGLAGSSTALAHVLKDNEGVGAVLHLKPDDAPIAGVPVNYVLTFQDASGYFLVSNCDCAIDFMVNDKIVARQILTAASFKTTQNTYTFPEPGIYTLRVAGAPKNGATFGAFTFDFVVRVGGGKENRRPIPLLLWVGIGMGTGLLLLYANTQNRKELKHERT